MTDQLGISRQGQGAPLTLIHGWGMNKAIFEPIMPWLQTDFMVTRIDLPGHGESIGVKSDDFEDQLCLLEKTLPASTLAGWSMGGLLAQQLALRWPEKFNKLVLFSCNPCFVQKPGWTCGVERSVFEEFARSLNKDWRATIQRFIGLQLHGLPQARDLIRQVTALLLRGGQPTRLALDFGLELLLEYDARADLGALNIPVMAILGARDKLVPPCLEQEIPLINPRIRVECLAQSAHAPFVSHAESVAELLRGFIKPPSTG